MTKMLALRGPTVSCALDARALIAIDDDGDAARYELDQPPRDLSALVPGCDKPDQAPLRLVVHVDGRTRGLRVRADLELFETDALYHMPRVLRDLGLAPWLRGVVVLDALPALWIDLQETLR